MLNRRVLAVFSLAISGLCWSGSVLADQSDGPAADSPFTSSITAGETFTCYNGSDGSIFCWGQAQNGQLGDTSYGLPIQKVPSQVSGSGSNFVATQISAGESHVCALIEDGKVKCWGKNDYGQTGNDKTRQSGSGNPNEVHWLHGTLYPGGGPTSVTDDNYVVADPSAAPLVNIVQVSAGISSTCALDSSQRIWCWGANSQGQSGYGDATSDSGGDAGKNFAVPRARLVRDGSSSPITGFTSVSVGERFACAIKQGGTVWCWGDNDDGQLGNGGIADSSTPIQVTGVTGATVISAGARHACVIASGGVKCWGQGSDGRLGSSRASGPLAPVSVDVSNAVRLSSGYAHSCALDSSAKLWCWGRFYDNYSADMSGGTGGGTASVRSGGVFGTSGTSTTPQQVVGLGSVKSFASGNNHVCAVEVDGPMKCWGTGSLGQLGNNQSLSLIHI